MELFFPCSVIRAVLGIANRSFGADQNDHTVSLDLLPGWPSSDGFWDLPFMAEHGRIQNDEIKKKKKK